MHIQHISQSPFGDIYDQFGGTISGIESKCLRAEAKSRTRYRLPYKYQFHPTGRYSSSKLTLTTLKIALGGFNNLRKLLLLLLTIYYIVCYFPIFFMYIWAFQLLCFTYFFHTLFSLYIHIYMFFFLCVAKTPDFSTYFYNVAWECDVIASSWGIAYNNEYYIDIYIQLQERKKFIYMFILVVWK